jgi:hypothetical protein
VIVIVVEEAVQGTPAQSWVAPVGLVNPVGKVFAPFADKQNTV